MIPTSARGSGVTSRARTLIPVGPTDHAYTAGIIDGEGSVLWNSAPTRMGGTVLLRVTNTDEELIDWLVARCSGVKNHDISGGRLGSKEIWRWTVSGFEAVIVIRTLLPHLIVKRRSAEIVLARWRETEHLRSPEILARAGTRMTTAGW